MTTRQHGGMAMSEFWIAGKKWLYTISEGINGKWVKI